MIKTVKFHSVTANNINDYVNMQNELCNMSVKKVLWVVLKSGAWL